MDTILKTNQLSKQYGYIKAVNGLNLNVERGTVFGILGPNGSGKTTTLAIILGVVNADSGTYEWNSNKFDNQKNKVGALLEQPNFYPYLSIYKNLEIDSKIKGIENIPEEINRVLRIVKLDERANAQFKQMSFGMKQRLALASVLLGDPEVLILDEPTNGLDPEGIAHVREIIVNEANKGKTIILASHILDEVEKVCSHVAILKKGNLIAQGNVKDLVNNEKHISLTSDNVTELYNLLKQSGLTKEISINKDIITLIPNAEIEPKQINQFAFQNGFILSKFEVSTQSLEDMFLEITK